MLQDLSYLNKLGITILSGAEHHIILLIYKIGILGVLMDAVSEF